MLAPIRSRRFVELLQSDPYVGYAYSYPHKTAYRTLTPARTLRETWSQEPRETLFLYLHIPFCEMRCGFCNLFTYSQPAEDWVAGYLKTLRRQMQVVVDQIPGANFTRLAMGGGTPTYLKTSELQQLFENVLEVAPRLRSPGATSTTLARVPMSVEASPATLDNEKLALLRQYDVERISLGIQSFLSDDLAAMGRPQRMRDVWRAVEQIRNANFPVLNLDLIYGAEGQTSAGWLESLREAARLEPEELFIYPLYVRPLTGLKSKHSISTDVRLQRYREARDWLLANNYDQVSMRMFRRRGQTDPSAPAYCCQSDGMVGLGAGARSYTRELHYASRFAVRQKSILDIIQDYIRRSNEDLAQVTHGFELNGDEQRRRYLLLSLLQVTGLDGRNYSRRFGSEPLTDFPQLAELLENGLAVLDERQLVLTADGLELSDALGPWLYSSEVKRRMEEFAWTDA